MLYVVDQVDGLILSAGDGSQQQEKRYSIDIRFDH